MEKNKLKLNLTFTFSEEAEVTQKDKEAIIDNVLTALRQQINSGMGIAPETPEKDDYITDFIDVRDEEGHGLTWDLGEDMSL